MLLWIWGAGLSLCFRSPLTLMTHGHPIYSFSCSFNSRLFPVPLWSVDVHSPVWLGVGWERRRVSLSLKGASGVLIEETPPCILIGVWQCWLLHSLRSVSGESTYLPFSLLTPRDPIPYTYHIHVTYTSYTSHPFVILPLHTYMCTHTHTPLTLHIHISNIHIACLGTYM